MTRLALALVFVLAGCAVPAQTVDRARLGDAAADLDGRSGTVLLSDGTVWTADALRLDPDTTSWIDAATGTLRAAPTSSVAEVRTRDPGDTVARSALVGAVVVGAAGGALWGLVCSDPTLGCGGPTPLAVGAGLVPAGALWGGTLGALRPPARRWPLAPTAPAEPTEE